jgi:hypothetical protein
MGMNDKYQRYGGHDQNQYHQPGYMYQQNNDDQVFG